MPRKETEHKAAKILPPGQKLLQITRDFPSGLQRQSQMEEENWQDDDSGDTFHCIYMCLKYQHWTQQTTELSSAETMPLSLHW